MNAARHENECEVMPAMSELSPAPSPELKLTRRATRRHSSGLSTAAPSEAMDSEAFWRMEFSRWGTRASGYSSFSSHDGWNSRAVRSEETIAPVELFSCRQQSRQHDWSARCALPSLLADELDEWIADKRRSERAEIEAAWTYETGWSPVRRGMTKRMPKSPTIFEGYDEGNEGGMSLSDDDEEPFDLGESAIALNSRSAFRRRSVSGGERFRFPLQHEGCFCASQYQEVDRHELRRKTINSGDSGSLSGWKSRPGRTKSSATAEKIRQNKQDSRNKYCVLFKSCSWARVDPPDEEYEFVVAP